MKFTIIALLFISTAFSSSAQKPKSGTYKYAIAYTEWNGKSLNATCSVIIKGDSIIILHDGNSNVSGKKGDIIDKGIIMRHIKTGKWIIGHSKEDKNAKEIGGCSDGPSIIDFKHQKFLTC